MDFQKLSEKIGKVDRQKNQWRNRNQREKINLEPRSALEKVIQDTAALMKELVRTREVDDSITIYNNARSFRHDIWVELVQTSSTSLQYTFGDIKVIDFIKDNNLDIKLVPVDLQNKSPDILAYNDRDKFIYLGDIAVSRTVGLSYSRKYIKYYGIAKMFEENNYKVKHINLIIDECMNNVHNQLKGLIDTGLIYERPAEIRRAIEYSQLCIKIMEYAINICVDKSEFIKRQDLIDKLDIKFSDEIELPNWVTSIDVEPEDARIEEERIIRWIKLETDKNVETFFDSAIGDTMNAFDTLIENNKKDKSYMNPRSTLQVVHNSYEFEPLSNYELLNSYIKDLHMSNEETIKHYATDLLPTTEQCNIMKILSTAMTSEQKKFKKEGVFGPYQYSRTTISSNIITRELNHKLTLGKKNNNVKTSPKTIDPSTYDDCFSSMEELMMYLGQVTNKTPFLDQTWDAKTNFELECTATEREIYEYCKKTCGAQLAHSLSGLYQRLMHVKTSMATKDNIYIPPNGSFIVIIPKNHAPISSARCDIPVIFITRVKNDTIETTNKVIYNEHEYRVKGMDYTYSISKLARINIDKMSNWDQAGYRLIATSSHLLSICPELIKCKERTIGLLTLMTLDLHQKTSEYLDLLKYVAFMPFSDISCLSKLIRDKFDLLIKTRLDVWMLLSLRIFITELAKIEKLNAKKPKVQLFNCTVSRESMGMIMNLPSFIQPEVRHNSVSQFIEEISMIYIVRPKHLYGSQFLDTAMNNLATWENEYKEEIEDNPGWGTEGRGKGKFPFNTKFCYSRDAIIHAMKLYHTTMPVNKSKVANELTKSKFNTYMHYNCSLRGCTKEKVERKNITDIHTTSMEACLSHYRKVKFVDNECTTVSIALDHLTKNIPQQYAMSEKDQRGGGRPISTPTLGTKAVLMMIEKPEHAIGTQVPNNIIVSGKNKLNEQCNTYKQLISDGAINKFREVYQLTEDQTKFSENDNTRKYEVYIKNNVYLSPKIRSLQLKCLRQVVNREHIVKRLPKSILDNEDLRKCVNLEKNGIKTTIGWPQGMLNFISTSIHSIADIWITHAYNKAYPDKEVMTKGLVHSDDSWVAVACNNADDFKRFAVFRTYAKQLFCLKVNIKKLWGSKYLGELVSNYNINGNVHLSVSKSLANSFGNLIYQNWVMDVHTQISSLQQAYRNGATLPTLILLSTILRQQVCDSYQVRGKQKELLYTIPIEIGGYPDNSTLELGVTGVTCHYKKILESVQNNPTEEHSLIILKAMRLSMVYNVNNEHGDDNILKSYISKTDIINKYYKKGRGIIDEDTGKVIEGIDFENVVIPSRGNVFTCVKHILPKSKKMTLTLNTIKSLPFVGEGLEMVVSRPKKLSIALGNLKEQTSSLIYALAAEKYTQSSRRLAVSQAIQSSGKVVRVGPFTPMTFNELLQLFLESTNLVPMPVNMLKTAFEDESSMSEICEAAVYRSVAVQTNTDKRKIINRIPRLGDKFKTVCPLQSVLLYIIDEDLNTHYRLEYTDQKDNLDILQQDSFLIRERFSTYFQFYKVKIASNLIMNQYLSQMSSKLWTQPFLRTDTLPNFIEDLYGKTISNIQNYNVTIDLGSFNQNNKHSNMVETIYTVDVLNTLYPDNFKVTHFDNVPIHEALTKVDYTQLSSDTYAKYGVIMHNKLNDDTFLLDYDEKKQYDQKYLVPQKYINNSYVGYFSCIARYGNTIIKISGEPGKMKVEANKANITDILMCMQIFTKQNFVYYQYPHPNQWSTTGFWRNPTEFSNQYLNCYSTIVTIINTSKTSNGVPFKLSPLLYMVDTYNRLKADKFEITNTYKEVYKHIGDKKVKVTSIKQSMHCPDLKKITIEPELIEGMDNQFLLESKIIINVTMKRHFGSARKDYLNAITTRLIKPNSRVVLDMWANLLNKFVEIGIEDREDNEYIESCIVKTFDIEGAITSQVLEDGLLTAPEDLTYVETKYVYEDTDRVGAIYQHGSLVKLFCNILTSHVSDSDTIDIIWLLLRDKDVSTIIKKDKTESINNTLYIEDKYNEALEAIDYIDISVDMYTFIVGKGLNKIETWNNIDLYKLIKKKYVNIKNSISHDMAFELKKKIKEIWEDIIDSDSDDLSGLLR